MLFKNVFIVVTLAWHCWITVSAQDSLIGQEPGGDSLSGAGERSWFRRLPCARSRQPDRDPFRPTDGLPQMMLSELPVKRRKGVPDIIVRLGTQIERVGGTDGIYRVPGNDQKAKDFLKSLMDKTFVGDLSELSPLVLASAMKKVFTLVLVNDRVIPLSILQKLVNIQWLTSYPNVQDTDFRAQVGFDRQIFDQTTLSSADEASLLMMCMLRRLPALNRNTIAYFLLHFQNIVLTQKLESETPLDELSLAIGARFWFDPKPLSTEFAKKSAVLLGSMYRDWRAEFICLLRTPESDLLLILCKQPHIDQALMAEYETRYHELNLRGFHSGFKAQLKTAKRLGYELVYSNIKDYRCTKH